MKKSKLIKENEVLKHRLDELNNQKRELKEDILREKIRLVHKILQSLGETTCEIETNKGLGSNTKIITKRVFKFTLQA